MYLIQTSTGERYFLIWDNLARLYKVLNIDTGAIMYWTSFDLQQALESGRMERIEY